MLFVKGSYDNIYEDLHKCVNPICPFPATISDKVENSYSFNYRIFFEADGEYYYASASQFLDETLVYKIVNMLTHLTNNKLPDYDIINNSKLVHSQTFYLPKLETALKDIPYYLSRLMKLRAFI